MEVPPVEDAEEEALRSLEEALREELPAAESEAMEEPLEELLLRMGAALLDAGRIKAHSFKGGGGLTKSR